MLRILRSAARAPRDWARKRHNSVTPLHEIAGCRSRDVGESQAVPTPEATQMPFLEEARQLRCSSYRLPAPSISTLQDVAYSGRYQILLTGSRSVIAESVSSACTPETFGVVGLHRGTLERIEGACTTIRSHRNEFYHTLIDNLPRLWVLHLAGAEDAGPVRMLLSSPLTAAEGYFLDRLLPEHVELEFLDPTRSYSVEKFILPSFLSRRFSGCLPTAYLDWFLPRVLPNRPRQSNRRILISRRPTSRGRIRCILNEDELFAALEPHGFERLALEDLSMAEQIDLFYDADVVIGAHGAGLTNLLFAQGAKVLELFPQDNVVPHYYFLCKAMGHDYAFCLGNGNHRKANFRVDVEAVMESVQRLEAGSHHG
jgi:capsular polysaccharide biosynthesis protein